MAVSHGSGAAPERLLVSVDDLRTAATRLAAVKRPRRRKLPDASGAERFPEQKRFNDQVDLFDATLTYHMDYIETYAHNIAKSLSRYADEFEQHDRENAQALPGGTTGVSNGVHLLPKPTRPGHFLPEAGVSPGANPLPRPETHPDPARGSRGDRA
jgi:hypothetical protein